MDLGLLVLIKINHLILGLYKRMWLKLVFFYYISQTAAINLYVCDRYYPLATLYLDKIS